VLLQGDLARYLLDKGLLEPDSIVSGDLDVQDASRRNRNFKILRKQSRCYFLKQGFGPLRLVEREAAVYGFLHSLPGAFAECLPNIRLHDCPQRILVLEIPHDSETVEEHCRRAGRIPAWAGARLGCALGDLHGLTCDPVIRESRRQEFQSELPWVFEIHKPGLRVFWGASEANLALIGIIQGSPGIRAGLEGLREEWHTECLVHGDLKSANLVIERGPSGRVRRGLKIIDWELAGYGDPAWDIGSVLSDCLALWVLSIPMAPEWTVEQSLKLARLPLERLVPWVRSFWRAYVERRGLEPEIAARLLRRSTTHAAARLLQTAYETTRQASRLPANAVGMVQLSRNLMSQPESAAATLLGLSAVPERL
jgi:phosphotransferase family enzyme